MSQPSTTPRRPQPTPSASFCVLHETGTCPSCPHQDTPLPLQVLRKQERVAALLSDAANPVPTSAWREPATSSPSRFRNKAKMAVSGTLAQPVLGLADTHGLSLDLRTCPLHVPEIEAVLPVLAQLVTELGLTPYDVPARRGELKHLLVTASPDGDLMVRFVLRSRLHLEALTAALPRIRSLLPSLAVLSVNIQPVHQAVIEGEEEIVLTGSEPGLSDRLLMRLSLPGVPEATGVPGPGRELPLYLPTRSFFQTNTGVAEQLYAAAAQWSQDLSGSDGAPALVWDLFCGVGGFALALAAPGRRVRGVEVSAAAIDGARDSVTLMGLSSQEAGFEAGDARVLDPGRGEVPDLLVVNPPRRGIGTDLAERIERSGVPRVLYSSCNPLTLAKDLERMPSLRARRAQLFDMFPHTDHAEVLVELVR